MKFKDCEKYSSGEIQTPEIIGIGEPRYLIKDKAMWLELIDIKLREDYDYSFEAELPPSTEQMIKDIIEIIIDRIEP